mgnify:CR=1 FL=1
MPEAVCPGLNIFFAAKNNLEYVKDDYDYIFIDNSPFKSALSNCSLCASDGVLTPINADNFSYDGLMDLIETIQNLNDSYSLSINFMGIFMTRVSSLRPFIIMDSQRASILF